MEKRQRLNRLILFGGIYFVEGAVLIYFSAFSVLYLRTFDLSFSRIGVIGGISLIPFVLKIFIGLLSDKVNLAGWGYRKPYILIGLVLQALAIFFIQFVSPVSQFPLFLVLMLLTALGMSTYDTCSDGLSIDTTPPEDRGLVQGIMVGGACAELDHLCGSVWAALSTWQLVDGFHADCCFGTGGIIHRFAGERRQATHR